MKESPIISTSIVNTNSDTVSESSPKPSPLHLLANMKLDEAYCTVTTNFHAEFLTYRSATLRFLYAAASKFKVELKTLFMAIACMDETLSKINIKREEAELIAGCCLYIASNYINKDS